MTHQISVNKTVALDELYNRIAQLAVAMGGRPSCAVSPVSFPSAMVATPRSEDVPVLQLKMPNGFEVKFSPTYPLSIGNALSVTATRIINGARKSDWMFTLGPNGWRRREALLADDEIRECLTPEGPPPA